MQTIRGNPALKTQIRGRFSSPVQPKEADTDQADAQQQFNPPYSEWLPPSARVQYQRKYGNS